MTYKGYLIDLDGTMYRGGEVISEAIEFVNELKRRELPYLFVTNNSTKTPEIAAAHLRKLSIPATPEHVYTSAMATASYIREQNPEARIYVIGEAGIREACRHAGLVEATENVDFVVVGLDRELTYQKIKQASLLIQQGATFIATNQDHALPTEEGLVPGNGSIVAAIASASGTKPMFVGKPEALIMTQALRKLRLGADETIMVGDNYRTDIMAGLNAGIDTMLVLSGVTTEADLPQLPVKPTVTLQALSQWTFDQ
ncbi:TIGR01457 family HAD-type hydrolase [Alkalicoccobacillus gibsonii]|uniref:TIGR01457 family HAD-type hydrolase n=1 Tax=Alkalicoccobacillus gibsonii TaxID=79881 RepID=A0ABU9VL10_9BACI